MMYSIVYVIRCLILMGMGIAIIATSIKTHPILGSVFGSAMIVAFFPLPRKWFPQ